MLVEKELKFLCKEREIHIYIYCNCRLMCSKHPARSESILEKSNSIGELSVHRSSGISKELSWGVGRSERQIIALECIQMTF